MLLTLKNLKYGYVDINLYIFFFNARVPYSKMYVMFIPQLLSSPSVSKLAT